VVSGGHTTTLPEHFKGEWARRCARGEGTEVGRYRKGASSIGTHTPDRAENEDRNRSGDIRDRCLHRNVAEGTRGAIGRRLVVMKEPTAKRGDQNYNHNGRVHR
jgi:hypothetical protein